MERVRTDIHIELPRPRPEGGVSLERCLQERRSSRDFRDVDLTIAQVAQLLWAAQGTTHPDGLRTAPSAGALFPLEVYLVAGRVTGVPEGLYEYESRHHQLHQMKAGDWRGDLSAACLDQDWVRRAPASIGISAVLSRVARRYGQRGTQYAMFEAGHAAQNVALQAVALGLGTVTVSAFHDPAVVKVLGLSPDETPLIIVPVGYSAPASHR